MEKDFEKIIIYTCANAIKVLRMEKLTFRPMRRAAAVNTKRGYVIGRTNLKTGLITIDILTPKFRKPKAIASILRTLCHEVAHHQKPPYRQRYRGKIINRQHYPQFYKQVNKNYKILMKERIV